MNRYALALARAMPAPLRKKVAISLLAHSAAASRPEDAGDLFKLAAHLHQSWPTATKSQEIHTAGLYAAIREVAEVEGAVVECGVGHGQSLVSLARGVERFSPGKEVIGFDSFAGFPPAHAADLGSRVTTADVPPPGWRDTSPEMVIETLDAPARVVAGFFSDTLATNIPEQISLLHVDCDLYDSTRDVLATCLERVQPRGIVIFDEYGEERWPGATRAVDEAGIRPVWEPYLDRFVYRPAS